MQLYVIDWLLQNSEDQLFATNEFCEFLKREKFNEFIEGFELIFMAHTPQNGSGVIICRAQNFTILFKLFKMWRENFGITFNIKPALTNDELLETQSSDVFWKKD